MVYLLHLNGLRKKMVVETKHSWKRAVHDRYHELKSMGESFFPYVVFKDVIAITIVFGVLVCLSIYLPPNLEVLADPADKNYNPRPEWYFLFLFQMLKYFPGWLETIAVVVIPAVLVGFLFLLPFIDRYSHRHPFDRPIITGLGIVAVLGMVYLGIEGYRAPLTNPIVERNPQEIEGQRLFSSLRCQSCHSIAGKGGVIGPVLDTIGSRKNKEWLTDHFKNPQKVTPGSLMPNFGLLDSEISNLVVYMSSLGGGSFSPKAPGLFKDKCATCHKIGNIGEDLGPDLSKVGQYREQGWLIKYIESPEKVDPNASMPGFSDSLSRTEIEDLARYLSAQRGGAP